MPGSCGARARASGRSTGRAASAITDRSQGGSQPAGAGTAAPNASPSTSPVSPAPSPALRAATVAQPRPPTQAGRARRAYGVTAGRISPCTRRRSGRRPRRPGSPGASRSRPRAGRSRPRCRARRRAAAAASSRIARRPSAASSAAMKSSELDRRAVADVVDPERRVRGAGVGGGRVPGRVGRGDGVGGADHPLGDVVDEGEVAAVPAVVVEPDRPARADRVGEDHRRHVGPAPGAVDGEEAQAGAGQGEEVGVGVRHQLVRPLGGGVELQRVADLLALGERHRRVGAVDARGRGEDQVRGPRRRQASSTWVKPVRLLST